MSIKDDTRAAKGLPPLNYARKKRLNKKRSLWHLRRAWREHPTLCTLSVFSFFVLWYIFTHAAPAS
jgi:hypothetical protein